MGSTIPGKAFGARRLIMTGISVIAAVVSLAVAPPVHAGSADITVATWNVCKLDCPSPAPSWEVRRARIANVVKAVSPDVLAVNEATNNQVGGRGTQWDDLQRVVDPLGYRAPDLEEVGCPHGACTNTARLLYRTSTIEQASFDGDLPSAGDGQLSEIAPSIGVYPDRQFTWAYLQRRDGGTPFLAISIHLTNDKSPAGERHRRAVGRALTGWVQRMNAARGLGNAPAIVMGDLNSTESRQPQGVQRVLAGAGWRDAIDAPRRVNADLNSVNYSEATPDGWPTKPFRYRGRLASRIDYIFVRGPVRPQVYEVVAFLDGQGRFKPQFQASDHQMVLAKLRLA